MSDGYNYLDADGVYTDPKTGILHNLAKISDKDALLFFESAVVAKRLTELSEHPICVKDTTALFDIHRHLFQDIYKWAGERRTVEISKGNAAFFPTSRFDQGLAHIDGLIGAFAEIDRLDAKAIAGQLARILDAVNHLHPFREGNGRTQREFIRILALQKGYRLELNPPADAAVYRRHMEGCIHADVRGLTALIAERLACV